MVWICRSFIVDNLDLSFMILVVKYYYDVWLDWIEFWWLCSEVDYS